MNSIALLIGDVFAGTKCFRLSPIAACFLNITKIPGRHVIVYERGKCLTQRARTIISRREMPPPPVTGHVSYFDDRWRFIEKSMLAPASSHEAFKRQK